MVIREMTFDDIAEVAELERAYSATPWDATGLFSWWMRDDTLFLVAGEEVSEETGEADPEDAGEAEYVPPVVYGYVGLVMVPYESDITNNTVSGECRRQGIATALLEELFRRCPKKGVTVVHLEVRESNAPARALYEKLGFVVDGRRKGYYTSPAEDAILMTRVLS